MLLHLALLAALHLGPQQPDRLSWVPNPTRTTGDWISDPAHHLSRATRDSINQILSALETQTSSEMGVAVLDTLDGLEPMEAALLLHRRWGVGKRARDNGIVLLWSPKLRKIAVSIGYGLEGVLPDARVGRIQDEAMLPEFRRERFDAGMIAGVRALAAAAREETHFRDEAGVAPGRPTPSEANIPRPASDARTSAAPVAAIVMLVVVFGVGVPLLLRYRRLRPRPCPDGHGPMRRLGEAEDDAALSAPELLEERLASIDYDVWVCDQCPNRIVIPYPRLFSGYSQCPSCRRKTLETATTTLVHATIHSEGLQLVSRHCKNCQFADQQERIIPRLPPPPPPPSHSSGSSSGGGVGGSSGSSGTSGGASFGGGSAGGGGASRTY